MIKFISKTILFVLITLTLLFAIVMSIIKLIPPQFDDLYQSEIVPKYNRLHNVEGKKIIYVTGSSGAFCIDSEKISKTVGREFVNLGLHAGFGHYYIDSIAKSGIKEGDIVILAHEMDTYYYDYYKGDIGLLVLSTDDNLEYIKYFSDTSKKEALNYLPGYIFKKVNKLLYEEKNYVGVYAKGAFNEYGDVNLELPFKKTELYHNINLYNTAFNPDVIKETRKFVEYTESKGAHFVIGFPYMKTKKEEVDYENAKNIEKSLMENLGVDELYPLEKAIKSEEYFYDTANHCNTWGKEKYSEFLAKQIKKYIEENDL